MTVIADSPFHPRGCTIICQSNTPCLCIKTFWINWRVGFDKNHLLLCYHDAPAADTLIASGFLGIEKEKMSVIHHASWKAGEAITCIPFLLRGFFLSYAVFESYQKRRSGCHCVLIFESCWAVLEYFWLRQMLRGFVTVPVSDKSSRFTRMWILVVHRGSCSHSNANGALRCDLRESLEALIKKYWLFLPCF